MADGILMNGNLFSDVRREALRTLRERTADRGSAEVTIKRDHQRALADAEQNYTSNKERLECERDEALGSAEAEFDRRRHEVESTIQRKLDQAKQAYDTATEQITEKAGDNLRNAQKKRQEAIWMAESLFEASEERPREQFEETERVLNARMENLRETRESYDARLKRYHQKPATPETSRADHDDPTEDALEEAIADAQQQHQALQRLIAPRLFQGPVPVILVLIAAAAGGAATAGVNDWQVGRLVWINAGIAAAASIALLVGLYVLARKQVQAIHEPWSDAIGRADGIRAALLNRARQVKEAAEREYIATRDREVLEANEKHGPLIKQFEERRDHHLKSIQEKYDDRVATLLKRRTDQMSEIEKEAAETIGTLKSKYEKALQENETEYQSRRDRAEEEYETAWQSLEQRWFEGVRNVQAAVEEISETDGRLFAGWKDSSWSDWQPPFEFAPAVRFGKLHVDRSRMDGGMPQDERLRDDLPESFDLPAALSFPNECSLLMKSGENGREQSLETLQVLMMRLLTCLPPGKVRFTIFDPVGLGQNFAGFMHLADYDEQLVTDKIWTDPRHIEQRLIDLTEHMENVIQKYLRNEFETIDEYNEHAGEIAEPYRFLVIADFPANFSESAAKRLMSIVSSGARCGVYALIAADTRKESPRDFQMADLQKNCVTLDWTDAGFAYVDEDYGTLPLTLDPAPPESLVTQTMHKVGKAGKDASRVEVPFDVIAPQPGELWSRSTTDEIVVPLGRAGATKLQTLELGHGTSQHALVAGKTGSGKSTLLHVLITNLALWYDPDEIEFYLVDFKKGVEFKTYARHKLPHARAVAVESDREFGLSVLQRLDGELKRRGNLFRELGVQGLSQYRVLKDQPPMPRTLLIIDEFQEFFTEDDKLGQDAALLLDRLVRQGRAFGIHVLLGSQTLGGAYSLARSTIGQMGVRIALQCSEADSYLILSDDNAAARLLSRPGEAIYNDSAGTVEGNSPFQICWLNDETRESHLRRADEMAMERGYRPVEPTIVFEGNVPAEVENNAVLGDLLTGPRWPSQALTQRAWLGEAIAIKEPTNAVFRRHSGSNLLILGQRDDAALGIMSAAIIGLAAQNAPLNGSPSGTIYVFDGSPPDSPNAGVLQQVGSHLPHAIRHVGWRDVEDTIETVAAEVKRRQEEDDSDAPPLYLFIFGLQRYRMLRQSEEFGFSMSSGDEGPATDRQFAEILREGPVVGVHTLTWCDTLTNLGRTMNRQMQREFEQRVLFQMSAADSAALIDTPAASRLGLKRALFFSEEDGVLEKFRPYAVPPDPWLSDLQERLSTRATAPAG